MESTREQLLHLLQSRGDATVAELAGALSVGQASVRRHLDHLRADGLADVRLERHGVGRPAFRYSVTEAGEERTPGGYARLLGRLYRGLRVMNEEELHGGGEAVLGSVFEVVAQQIAREHRTEVPAEALKERVAKTSRALHAEGIVDGWNRDNNGYHLTNSACPYRQAAAGSRGTCELDRRTIELLVSAPVRQVRRIADGDPVCEYIVSAVGDRRPEQEPVSG